MPEPFISPVTLSWVESTPSLCNIRLHLSSCRLGLASPSQAPCERSFACKQDHYYDRYGDGRYRDKIEDCPSLAEPFKDLCEMTLGRG